jgi:hypothetical protein
LAAQTARRATTATPPMLEPTPTPILALELRLEEPPAVVLDDWVETPVWGTERVEEDVPVVGGEGFVI